MIALLAALEAQFDDAEGGIRIVGADWIDGDLEVTPSITYHDECEAEQWTISCLLGRFPASVAERIVEALKDKPIRLNALAGLTPKWNGSEHIPYSETQALEIERSYVIAER